jgi:NADH dehydrogenase [ubiquinone] 1 alpha subcomplex assembly factor 3
VFVVNAVLEAGVVCSSRGVAALCRMTFDISDWGLFDGLDALNSLTPTSISDCSTIQTVKPAKMNTFTTTMPRLATRALKQQASSCKRCLHMNLSQRTQAIRQPAPSPLLKQQQATSLSARCLHASARALAAPKSKDRGPASKEDTQTDFGALDVLGGMPPPTTGIDACMEDGFALNNGSRITGAGVMLVGGEAFKWRPWIREEGSSNKLKNAKGQWEADKMVWGALDLVWPKPDLLILGTGPGILPLSPKTRNDLTELGIRVEVQDTRNAAAQFNLLATERGLQQVAAAFVPIGWREGA